MHHQQYSKFTFNKVGRGIKKIKKLVVHSLLCMISLGHSSEDAKMVATGLSDWSSLILFCRM